MTIHQVATAADQAAVCAILAQAFGLAHAGLTSMLNVTQLSGPGLTIYLACQGEQPVSTVATIITGSIVGIWSMATLPEQQRKGIGRTLLSHVMAQHQERGVRDIYLWSTAAGQRLYGQLGFRTVAELSIWTTGRSMQVHY
jgi:GNAT superfamily N-acetyltransferase